MKPVAFFALLCFAVPAASQSTGANVAGVVTDSSGARLPDAKVSIALFQSGQSVTVTTGREGEYRAVALLPGAYELSAERLGFTRVTRRITLLVGADATVNFILPIAGV